MLSISTLQQAHVGAGVRSVIASFATPARKSATSLGVCVKGEAAPKAPVSSVSNEGLGLLTHRSLAVEQLL